MGIAGGAITPRSAPWVPMWGGVCCIYAATVSPLPAPAFAGDVRSEESQSRKSLFPAPFPVRRWIMFEKISSAAERLAANVSESRRGFFGRVGQAALAVAAVF